MSTIADTGMGTAAHRVAGDKRCVTINLDLKFISAGQLGDKLKGDVKILKKTKTLVFISCEISNDKENCRFCLWNFGKISLKFFF